MATATYVSKGGDDRLVIATICTHLPFFHEAGFALRTERRQRVPFRLFDPASWRGERWSPSGDALQPVALQCIFIQRGDVERDRANFDVITERNSGTLKSSCDHMMARAHCIHVVNAEQPATVAAASGSDDARSVINVGVRFTYDDQEHVLWHAPPKSAAQRVTHVDNASTPAR